MDLSTQEKLNEFFVDTFNYILVGEERWLALAGVTDLSMREVHVISVVQQLETQGLNSMSRVAEELFISAGALTTAVNTLIRKGYLSRERDEDDRRIVLVSITEAGQEIVKKHDEFHKVLIEHVSSNITDQELELLTKSLEQIKKLVHTYVFDEMRKE